jgi:GT2 family glycosyltransferase
MTKVAVVILNFNGENFLKEFLPSVIRYSKEATVIVVDNGSHDQSVQMVKQEFPSVQLLALPENLGFCGGYNTALRQIQSTYYLLLNSDVEVTEGWLTPLMTALDKNVKVAAVQPKIRSFHQRSHFEYAGAAGGFIDSMGYPFCRGRIFQTVEEDRGQYDTQIPVLWTSGACMLIRASQFHLVGGFDEDYFAHMEEVDLCWKLNRLGFETHCVPESIVYHVGGGTLTMGSSRKTFLNFRNGLSLLFKHTPDSELWWRIPIRWLLDYAAALTFLPRSRSNAWAVIRAHVHFFKSLQKEKSKRRRFKKQAKTFEASPVYQKSIVRDYFLDGFRTFEQLPGRFSNPK